MARSIETKWKACFEIAPRRHSLSNDEYRLLHLVKRKREIEKKKDSRYSNVRSVLEAGSKISNFSAAQWLRVRINILCISRSEVDGGQVRKLTFLRDRKRNALDVTQ